VQSCREGFLFHRKVTDFSTSKQQGISYEIKKPATHAIGQDERGELAVDKYACLVDKEIII